MKKAIIIILNICIVVYAASPAFAHKDEDWQLWDTSIIEKKIDDTFKVKAEEELRFGNDITRLYYHHTDIGLNARITQWFDIGVNYRQVYEKKEHKWKEENRPHISGTFNFDLYDFKLKDRNRLEYRIRKYANGTLRYRNKLTMIFPVEWTSFEVQPYIADEIFVDSEAARVNRNRLYGGVKLKLLEHLNGELFYMRQSADKSGKWIDSNVVGIKLKVGF